jgi:hypothetical protein
VGGAPAVLVAFAIRITFADVPPAVRPVATEEEFRQLITSIEQSTARRLAEGEWDHFVYFLLQSRSFTDAAPIEPSRSAKQLHATGSIPAEVEVRVDAFLGLGSESADNARLRWALNFARTAGRDRILSEYRRAMRFLYEKEWGTAAFPAAERRARIAALYRDRGHSSDTRPDSGLVLEAGIDYLRRRFSSASLCEVLLIGPGVDLAPRTGLLEDTAPQSYQPEVLRRMLPGARLSIADVNPRVVSAVPGTERLNLITERLDRRFDLIVLTNVLLYFSDVELTLAFANLAAMLEPGGFLLHNETRPEVDSLSGALGLPIIHAGMVRLPGTAERSLFDAVVLHRRAQP